MERVPTQMTTAGWAAFLGLMLLTTGCVHSRKAGGEAAPSANPAPLAKTKAEKSSIWPVSFQEISTEIATAMKPAEPAAAGEIVCLWQNRVSYLPDPSRNGAMAPGLAGQLFLFGVGTQNAVANGKLTVDMFDESDVHNGTPPKQIERWEFDKETLKKLASFDETFGRSYTLFLPWPSYRPTVNNVRLMVKYEPTTGYPLFAPAAPVSLDASTAGMPVWSGGSTNGPTPQTPATPSNPSTLPGGMPSAPVRSQSMAPPASAYPTAPVAVAPTQPAAPAGQPQLSVFAQPPQAVCESQPALAPQPSNGFAPPAGPGGLPPLAIISGSR